MTHDIRKKLWLVGYLERKLMEIKNNSKDVFSNSEKYYIKGLCMLYKISREYGDYYAEKYKKTIIEKDRKEGKIEGKKYLGG